MSLNTNININFGNSHLNIEDSEKAGRAIVFKRNHCQMNFPEGIRVGFSVLKWTANQAKKKMIGLGLGLGFGFGLFSPLNSGPSPPDFYKPELWTFWIHLSHSLRWSWTIRYEELEIFLLWTT